MITRLLSIHVALIGLFCPACYPVQEHPQRGVRTSYRELQPPGDGGELVKPLENTAVIETTRDENKETAGANQPNTAQEPPTVKVKPGHLNQEIITATKASGKQGYVLSPYTGKLILISGIPSGVVVPDQTCPPSEKRSFRVP